MSQAEESSVQAQWQGASKTIKVGEAGKVKNTGQNKVIVRYRYRYRYHTYNR